MNLKSLSRALTKKRKSSMDYFIIMIKHYLLSLIPYFSGETPPQIHMLLNLSAVKVRRFTFSGLSVKIIGMQNCAVQFKLSYLPITFRHLNPGPFCTNGFILLV